MSLYTNIMKRHGPNATHDGCECGRKSADFKDNEETVCDAWCLTERVGELWRIIDKFARHDVDCKSLDPRYHINHCSCGLDMNCREVRGERDATISLPEVRNGRAS